MTCLDLTVYRGDSLSIHFAFKEPDGTPTDLTGATIVSQIRTTVESATVVETLNPTIDAPGTLGTGKLYLSAVETLAIAAGEYVFDARITPTDRIFVRGKLTFATSVTR